MLEIQTLKVGPLQTNCYLVIAETSQHCLIIDPGDSAELISSEIMQQSLQPESIVATHGHFDHILAAKELQMAFGIPFLVQAKDEFLVNTLTKRAKHWLHREIIEQPPQINDFLTVAKPVKLGQQELRVFASPGHTPGGVCLVNDQAKVIFTGDTIFARAVGRTDLSYSSSQALNKSVARLRQQFEDYHAYPGHGQDFYL